MVMLKQSLPFIAVIVSVVSFGLSYAQSRNTAVASVMPVLAFVYDGQVGWTLQNIGNGPSINITVAQRDEKSGWQSPVRLPPLAKDGKLELKWLGHSNVRFLGADYSDFQGRRYSAVSVDDISANRDAHVLPVWRDDEIQRYWEQESKRK